jgi:hypothetical protein
MPSAAPSTEPTTELSAGPSVTPSAYPVVRLPTPFLVPRQALALATHHQVQIPALTRVLRLVLLPAHRLVMLPATSPVLARVGHLAVRPSVNNAQRLAK